MRRPFGATFGSVLALVITTGAAGQSPIPSGEVPAEQIESIVVCATISGPLPAEGWDGQGLAAAVASGVVEIIGVQDAGACPIAAQTAVDVADAIGVHLDDLTAITKKARANRRPSLVEALVALAQVRAWSYAEVRWLTANVPEAMMESMPALAKYRTAVSKLDRTMERITRNPLRGGDNGGSLRRVLRLSGQISAIASSGSTTPAPSPSIAP